MNISDASRALADESKTAPDCAKPLNALEKLLRERNVWPKARPELVEAAPEIAQTCFRVWHRVNG
jgi:hypothetical protein